MMTRDEILAKLAARRTQLERELAQAEGEVAAAEEALDGLLDDAEAAALNDDDLQDMADDCL